MTLSAASKFLEAATTWVEGLKDMLSSMGHKGRCRDPAIPLVQPNDILCMFSLYTLSRPLSMQKSFEGFDFRCVSREAMALTEGTNNFGLSAPHTTHRRGAGGWEGIYTHED